MTTEGGHPEASGGAGPGRGENGVPPWLERSAGLESAGGTGRRTGPDGADELPPGTVLSGRYQVRALLGKGGMGAVYRVFDDMRGTEVALKTILPAFLDNVKARERFAREIEVALRLSHEHIVRVYDVHEDAAKRLRFFTMELLEGSTLRQWLGERKARGEAVELGEALEIGRQLLEALAYAHETTIHRDLKPENVFVLKPAPLKIKVLDLGIAKPRAAAGLTATASTLGTPYYLAPEQHGDAARADARSDLYSVSVILYELLTGEIPMGRFPAPSKVRAGVPGALDDLILAGLARKPEDRPQSAAAMLTSLGRIRTSLREAPPPRAAARGPAAEPPPPPPPPLEPEDAVVARPLVARPLASRTERGPHGRPIPNYLVHAIFATLCCCLPSGIVAIVYAAQVNEKIAASDHAGAMRASNNAQTWCWVSFFAGLALLVLQILTFR